MLSIIIVNYKTPELVMNCLNSIMQFTNEAQDYEIFVVDNDSKDGCGQLVKEKYPSVKWLEMGYNAGFARANNAAMRLSNGDAVLLLNSDTIVEEDAVQQCYKRLMQSDYLACGVQLLNEDRTPQISGNFFMKGSLNNLLPIPYTGALLRAFAMLMKVRKTNVPNASAEVRVDWINGAFLMVKKQAIERIGLMDEDFFLYAEEAEWCSRIGKIGKLSIFGEYHVLHLQGESAKDAFGSAGKGYQDIFDRKGLQIMLSNFVRIRKQFGIGWFFFHLLVYSLSTPLLFAGPLVELILLMRNPLPLWKKSYGYFKNVLRCWQLSLTIIRNRPYFYKVL